MGSTTPHFPAKSSGTSISFVLVAVLQVTAVLLPSLIAKAEMDFSRPGTGNAALSDSSRRSVCFAQITDPHIFDEPAAKQDNLAALKWCIDQIRAGEKQGYDFVALTGDLGIRSLYDSRNLSDTTPEEGSRYIANLISASSVKTWLLLPGNNDLIDENPSSIKNFHDFVNLVRQNLVSFEIVDLCPRENDFKSGIYQVGKYYFVGFDDSSFKNNDRESNAITFRQVQLQQVNEVVARLSSGNFDFAYVLCHIPEIDDPFYLSQDPGSNYRLSGKGSSFPFSAWTVHSEVRKRWTEEVVENEKVRGVFAGHFHSRDRTKYSQSYGWILSPNMYSSNSLAKLHLCPPLANKHQEARAEQARGFQEVWIYAGGAVKCNVIWYTNGTGL